MRWLITRYFFPIMSTVVAATAMVLGTGSVAAANFYSRIPEANRQLLVQLDTTTGLSKDWNGISHRDTSTTMTQALTNASDREAWAVFESRFLLSESASEEWRRYWRYIPWSAPSSSVSQYARTNARLLSIPLPAESTDALAEDYPGPLPGDVILIRGGVVPIAGIYYGERSFPGRRALASFFYFSNHDAVEVADGVSLTSGIGFNTYPPRLTPALVRSLYPNVGEYLNPNSKLFRGARGYLSTALKKAYGGYFLPTKEWPSVTPQVSVFRRRSSSIREIVVRRRWETQRSTISTFDIAGTQIRGYFLENPGPPTKQSGQRRRIPPGVYKLTQHSGPKYQNVYKLYNNDVPQIRAILIHAGNHPEDTDGCLLPGSVRRKDFVGGTNSENNSSAMLGKINEFVKNAGLQNVRVVIHEPTSN